jgi:excisionase family DNA binding protein
MNKKEAALALGVTTKTIERLTTDGKLNPKKVRGRTGLENQFDEGEIEALKIERQTPIYEARQTETSLDKLAQTSRDITEILPSVGNPASARNAFTRDLMLGFASMVREVDRARINSASIDQKLALTIEQASELSEIPKAQLRRDIQSKKLKAILTGAGYRIKRPDLDSYIKRL